MKRFICIGLVFFSLAGKAAGGEQVAIAAIFRDEARFLKEWICFHQLLGVGKFYLYNNLSQDNYSEVLAPFVNSGVVELVEWPRESYGVDDWHSIQIAAYRHAMGRARAERVKWLAVIDVDEFIVPRNHKTIIDMLNQYPKAGGVMLNWVLFGTSNIDEIPAHRLMIEMLTMNLGYQRKGVKTIYRTDRGNPMGPHIGFYFKGFKGVELPFRVAQLNHYWSRDKKFFYEVKAPRRVKLKQSVETSEAWVADWNRDNPESAQPIMRFVNELKVLMGYQ